MSALAASNQDSFEWRENFIATFLERDLLQWAGFNPATMRRLWQMLAHLNGQTANYSRLASALGVSATMVRNYVDLLASTFMLDIIPPHHSNLRKRLVKAPKVYLNDTGITAALLDLHNFESLIGHPGFGALWEQAVLANIRALFPRANITHYRSSHGAEADFIVSLERRTCVVECKASLSPTLSRGFFNALDDIRPSRATVVIPATQGWPMQAGLDCVGMDELPALFEQTE
ncbi:MAG: DUF4143 domain-containing protein [Actinomycetes bacterium]|nr:DUF4143 domain-containing protein [Actinomycetes bacterium]